jgi:hypothetical protein
MKIPCVLIVTNFISHLCEGENDHDCEREPLQTQILKKCHETVIGYVIAMNFVMRKNAPESTKYTKGKDY